MLLWSENWGSDEFFDDSVLQKHTEKEFTMN